ncbi:hypothetical protein DPMN_193897 [Dreissena polymorpha]|uniref:Uncharacterized protein n=1 Tax=Dreissena polymorpha TaxID=45954 RepID=A0A9D3Y2Y1_DREPO|nr:hypothetical protein DPMN_193897 [Dreissena polymorpha]
MSQKTAPHLLHGVQIQRVRRTNDRNTCWSTRAPSGDRQTTLCARLFVLQGTLEGGRRRQKKSWMDNIKELTSLPSMNYSQKHKTDLTGGGFLYRHPSFPPSDQTCQVIDDYTIQPYIYCSL